MKELKEVPNTANKISKAIAEKLSEKKDDDGVDLESLAKELVKRNAKNRKDENK